MMSFKWPYSSSFNFGIHGEVPLHSSSVTLESYCLYSTLSTFGSVFSCNLTEEYKNRLVCIRSIESS
jgi:hypothetical protein